MRLTAISAAAAIAAALALVLSGCGCETKTEQSTTTSAKASPSRAKGPHPTIADYIRDNNIQETQVRRGDPGSPNIDLPLPDGWEPAGDDTPDWAYGAIIYTGPEAAKYSPSITALVSKLTGDVDPQQIIDLAPGELQNMPGWRAMNDGEVSTLGGYPAYQLAGTWLSDGVSKIVAQKTVVIPGSDGLYVLQLNADALESQAGIVGTATTIIDEQTTIGF